DTVVYVGPQNGYKAEDSEDPRFVAITTPKGYRFLVPVTGIQYAVPAENQSKALPAAQKLTR
ncbi:MAG: hypothetical protein ACRDHG_01090, partial [Anaerolineales bacterium]